MKKFFSFLSLVAVVTLIGCGDPEPPSMRVYNERTTKANVQIKTAAETININDVNPGAVTDYRNIVEGDVEITATIQSESVSPTASFRASNDNNFTIVVANTTPPTIKINVEKK